MRFEFSRKINNFSYISYCVFTFIPGYSSSYVLFNNPENESSSDIYIDRILCSKYTKFVY